MNKQDVKIGDRFGRLCVIGFKHDHGRFMMRCDCGAELNRPACMVLSGGIKSCGCLNRDVLIARNKSKDFAIRGGLSKTLTGASWLSMIARCYRKTATKYPVYGAVGIVVCEYLRASITNLVEMIGYRPEGHSIDRINTLGSYTCGKCSECLSMGWEMNIRWATSKQQSRNQTTNRLVTINGETRCVAEWSERCGISQGALLMRLRLGWEGEKLLSSLTPSYPRRKPKN